MKVLMLEPCARDFGGFFRANYIARSLARRGHEVTMLFPAGGVQPWVKCSRPEVGLTFIELPNMGTNLPLRLLSKIIRIPLILGWLLFSRYDLVHIFATVHPEHLAAAMLCRALNKRFLSDWDDYWQDSMFFEFGNPVVRWYIRFAEVYGVRLASAVTVASDYLHKQADGLGCKLVHKCPNGVWTEQFALCSRDEARARLGILDGSLVLLAFGNTYLHGRGEMLLRCCDHILMLNPATVILFNKHPRDVWRENGAVGAAPESLRKIRLVGQIPQTELGVYLGACDFVLFFSSDRPSEQACFPIRIGSYLNGEAPIATNRAQTETCRLVETFQCGIVGGSPQEVAGLVISTSTDHQRMSQLRKGARDARMALDYGALISSLIELYAAVAKNAPFKNRIADQTV